MSKKELQDIVSKQQLELSRYKARLADLVAAHKCLLKEKEALELSLKALSEGQKNVDSTEENCESNNMEEAKGNNQEKENSGHTESVEQLKLQLSTLMNSIATLSEEKSRMEASFQADKRQLRVEKIQLENTVKELQNKLETEAKNHVMEMESFKSKLVVERYQREKEHNDHGVMIRELQKVVAEERGKREKAESLAEGLKREVAAGREAKENQERRVKEMSSELEEVRGRLQEDKVNSGAQNSRLVQQLNELKMQHVLATRKEQERATEAEERTRRLAAAHEERVANLEARLAELSQTVGSYDRLRHQDQLAIDKLKERLLQLEMEHGEEKGDSSVDELVNKLRHVKYMLETANQVSEKPVDIAAILLETAEDSNIALCGHEMCQQDFDQLKLEFDNYKKQYQLSHQASSQNSMRLELNKEVDSLRGQVHILKERIRNLHDQIENMEQEHKRELEIQHQAVINERSKYKDRVATMESEWRGRVSSLEMQLSKQRERALSLVKEKDQEIATLKESFHNLIPHPRAYTPEKEGEENRERKESVAGGGPMLHFNQELARKDVELARLRKDKHVLEADLREAQRLIAHHSQKVTQLNDALQKQLERFSQCQSREGANLEYLKNVVLSFLLSNDASSKAHMLNAIAAVLKFTDMERNKIAQHSWWYNRIAHT